MKNLFLLFSIVIYTSCDFASKKDDKLRPITEIPQETEYNQTILISYPTWSNSGDRLYFSTDVLDPVSQIPLIAPSYFDFESKSLHNILYFDGIGIDVCKEDNSIVFQNRRPPYRIFHYNMRTDSLIVLVGEGSDFARERFNWAHVPKFNPTNSNQIAFWASNLTDTAFETFNRGIALVNSSGTEGYYALNGNPYFQPAWHPNGYELYFAANEHSGYDPPRQIYKYDLRNNSKRKLTNLTGETRHVQELKISPNGETIALNMAHPDNGTSNLAFINIDGSNLRFITKFSRPVRHVSWHPNGEYLILTVIMPHNNHYPLLYDVKNHKINFFNIYEFE